MVPAQQLQIQLRSSCRRTQLIIEVNPRSRSQAKVDRDGTIQLLAASSLCGEAPDFQQRTDLCSACSFTSGKELVAAPAQVPPVTPAFPLQPCALSHPTSAPKTSRLLLNIFCHLDRFNRSRLGVIAQVAPEGNLMQQEQASC